MPFPSPILPAKPRRHYKRRDVRPIVGPTALVLVSAIYAESYSLTLTFDRAIDISSLDGSAITVDDGTLAFRYIATGDATLVSPTTVELILNGWEELPFTGVHMTATNANGIVASGDEAAWAGVSDVELPFP